MNAHDFSIQLLTHSLQKWLQNFPLPNINLPHLSNVLLVFFTYRGPDPAPRLVYASFDYMGDDRRAICFGSKICLVNQCHMQFIYLISTHILNPSESRSYKKLLCQHSLACNGLRKSDGGDRSLYKFPGEIMIFF